MSIFILKIIAIISMIIDHTGVFFIQNSELYVIFRIIGRISAPIFIFVFIEGFKKTKNRQKYKHRLLISSIIMFIGNIILIESCSLFNIRYNTNYTISVNIFFTMYIGFILLENIEKLKIKFNVKYVIFILINSIIMYFCEYSYIALGLIIIFYFFENKYQMIILYIIIMPILCLLGHNILQIFMLLSIIPLFLYNNELGYRSKFLKYFYYFFYPIHLWLFFIISLFIFN